MSLGRPVMDRMRDIFEQAAYNDTAAVHTRFRREPGTRTSSARESIAGRAYMAISREEAGEAKMDFDLANEKNDRWFTLYDSAQSSIR